MCGCQSCKIEWRYSAVESSKKDAEAAKAKVTELKEKEAARQKAKAAAEAEIAKLKAISDDKKKVCTDACNDSFSKMSALLTELGGQATAEAVYGALEGIKMSQDAMNAALADQKDGYFMML